MNYIDDIRILTNLKTELIEELYEEDIIALNDAISALKTLNDMGETMNKILREEHKTE